MSTHAHDRNYVRIWGVLLVLLLISVFGPMLEIRLVTLITAFGVALLKAYLVAKNFMHLDIEKPFVHWMLALALALMVILYAGVAPDVYKEGGRGWKKAPVAEPADRGHEAAQDKHGKGDAGH